MTIKEAIKKAIQAGWDRRNSFGDIVSDLQVNAVVIDGVFLSPSFWQSLGKALGWEEVGYRPHLKRENGIIYVGITEYEMWKSEWHRFIDHLAAGQTPESFFKTLN